jgi:hypothetical protein
VDVISTQFGRWFHSGWPALGSGTIEDLLERVIASLQKSGHPVPPSGRHNAALRILQGANRDEIDIGLPATRGKLAHAQRVAIELIMIVYARYLRGPKPNSPFTRRRFQEAFGGKLDGSEKTTTARDYAFELFVAAYLTIAGRFVTDGEPDLRFLYALDERVGVAVKRVTSLAKKQLAERIGDAVRQIDASGRRGWIAVNLDTRFHGRKLFGNQDEVVRSFDDAFNTLLPLADAHSANRMVMGILAFGYLSEWTDEGDKPGLMWSTPFRYHGFIDPDPMAQRLADKIGQTMFETFDARLPGMIPPQSSK